MQHDPNAPWPEYLRAWLSALRYHPEQHYLRGHRHDDGTGPEHEAAARSAAPERMG
jgi:hypothetical protein